MSQLPGFGQLEATKKTKYLFLCPEPAVVRLIGPPLEYLMEWKKEDNADRLRPIRHHRNYRTSDSNIRLTRKRVYPLIDKENGRILLGDFPKAVFDWFDSYERNTGIVPWDLEHAPLFNITKNGSGKETRYTTRFSQLPYPLTPQERMNIEKKGMPNLAREVFGFIGNLNKEGVEFEKFLTDWNLSVFPVLSNVIQCDHGY